MSTSLIFKKIMFQKKCNLDNVHKIKDNPFKFNKPKNWSKLALFEKIKYYGLILTKDYSPYVDKLNCKSIIEEICKQNNISNLHIPKVVKILDNNLQNFGLKQEDLPCLLECMIKGNHGSKYNIILGGDETLKSIKSKLNEWNRKYIGSEKQYDHITPTFFIEEKIDDYFSGKSGYAATFMFRCIYGKPVSIGISYKRNIDNYYLDLSPIKVNITEININLEDIKNELKQMYDLSVILSSKFEFVRVDFYLSKERKIYFSEFTFTPKAGVMNFPTYEIEYELGKSWV